MNRYDLIMDREPALTASTDSVPLYEKRCCKTALVFEKSDISIQQAKCSVCGTHYQFRTGSFILYKYKTIINEGTDCACDPHAGQSVGWVCTVCGSEVQGTTVYHPIHDGPFPLSGSGRVYRECVPYCPKCEKQPDASGSFIRPEK